MTVSQNAGQEFLRLLWGDDPPGQIQTWTLADKRSEYWPHWRGVQKDGQRDVFCAMGTTARRLGARQRATAQQVCAIAGCWLDLDVKEEAFTNLGQAIVFANLDFEPTLLVNSGHGLHAYYLFVDGPWTFRSLDERAEAASLVHRWLVLAQRRAAPRWHIDSIFDLARLMRLPGTINAKDPSNPRPVHVIEDGGPRYTQTFFRSLLGSVELPPAAPPSLFDAPVTLTGDTSAYDAKLDALLANSPDFADVWTGARTFPSMSEADLSLCSLAAGAMTDPELAALIAQHRAGDPKAQRADYLARTIRRARTGPRHDETTTRRAA